MRNHRSPIPDTPPLMFPTMAALSCSRSLRWSCFDCTSSARRNNYVVNRSAEVFRVMGCHCWTQWPEDFYRVNLKKASVRNGCRLATRLSSPFDRFVTPKAFHAFYFSCQRRTLAHNTETLFSRQCNTLYEIACDCAPFYFPV